jgi:flagellar protein FliJ
MTLSIDGYPGDVSRWVTCSADLKRRITILRGLIADFDRMAADLDNEVRNEENRVEIYNRAHIAYSIYAKESASRRDDLKRSADELSAHLAEAEKAVWSAVQQEINAEKERTMADRQEA